MSCTSGDRDQSRLAMDQMAGVKWMLVSDYRRVGRGICDLARFASYGPESAPELWTYGAMGKERKGTGEKIFQLARDRVLYQPSQSRARSMIPRWSRDLMQSFAVLDPRRNGLHHPAHRELGSYYIAHSSSWLHLHTCLYMSLPMPIAGYFAFPATSFAHLPNAIPRHLILPAPDTHLRCPYQ